MRMPRILVVMLFVLSAGCDQQAMLNKLASAEDQEFAKRQVHALQAGDFAEIEKLLDPSAKSPELRDTLKKMADFIPAGEPKEIRLVGVQSARSSGGSTATSLTYEYEYPNKWLVIIVATRKDALGTTIDGFRVIPQTQGQADMHRFRLTGKTPLQYLVLALAIVVPLLSLYALVLCIRTPFKGRKWPWVLFILFGVCQLAVNWTTGEWAIKPISIMLFGAGATAQPYGPWIISVAVPLGALLFLMRRNKLRAGSEGSSDQGVSVGQPTNQTG